MTWCGIVTPWLPSSVSFVVALFNDVGLPAEIYFLIGNISAPIFIVAWMVAFTDLVYPSRQKIGISFSVIYGIIFEALFLYFLFTDSSLIGELKGPVDVDYKFIMVGLALSVIVYFVITGILFSRASMKSDVPEHKIKGKFLLIAFISYAVGAVLDAAIPLNPITLPITRLILISSAIEWYIGFTLPEFIKKIFLKNEKRP